MQVCGVHIEFGKPYKSADLWQELHSKAMHFQSTPLLQSFFGAPEPLPYDRAFAEESLRIQTARRSAVQSNIAVIDKILGTVYKKVQKDTFEKIAECIRAEGTAIFSEKIPTIFASGDIGSHDNAVHIKDLEAHLLDVISPLVITISSSDGNTLPELMSIIMKRFLRADAIHRAIVITLLSALISKEYNADPSSFLSSSHESKRTYDLPDVSTRSLLKYLGNPCWTQYHSQLLESFVTSLASTYMMNGNRSHVVRPNTIQEWYFNRAVEFGSLLPKTIIETARSINPNAVLPASLVSSLDALRIHAYDTPLILIKDPETFNPHTLSDLFLALGRLRRPYSSDVLSRPTVYPIDPHSSLSWNQSPTLTIDKSFHRVKPLDEELRPIFPLQVLIGSSVPFELFLKNLPFQVSTSVTMRLLSFPPAAETAHVFLDRLLMSGGLPMQLSPKVLTQLRAHATAHGTSAGRTAATLRALLLAHHSRTPALALRTGSSITNAFRGSQLAGGGTINARTPHSLGEAVSQPLVHAAGSGAAGVVAGGLSVQGPFTLQALGLQRSTHRDNVSIRERTHILQYALARSGAVSMPASQWLRPLDDMRESTRIIIQMDSSNNIQPTPNSLSQGSGTMSESISRCRGVQLGLSPKDVHGAVNRAVLNVARLSILCLPFDMWSAALNRQLHANLALRRRKDPSLLLLSKDGKRPIHIPAAPTLLEEPTTNNQNASFLSSALWALISRLAMWIPRTEVEYYFRSVPSLEEAYYGGSLLNWLLNQKLPDVAISNISAPEDSVQELDERAPPEVRSLDFSSVAMDASGGSGTADDKSSGNNSVRKPLGKERKNRRMRAAAEASASAEAEAEAAMGLFAVPSIIEESESESESESDLNPSPRSDRGENDTTVEAASVKQEEEGEKKKAEVAVEDEEEGKEMKKKKPRRSHALRQLMDHLHAPSSAKRPPRSSKSADNDVPNSLYIPSVPSDLAVPGTAAEEEGGRKAQLQPVSEGASRLLRPLCVQSGLPPALIPLCTDDLARPNVCETVFGTVVHGEQVRRGHRDFAALSLTLAASREEDLYNESSGDGKIGTTSKVEENEETKGLGREPWSSSSGMPGGCFRHVDDAFAALLAAERSHTDGFVASSTSAASSHDTSRKSKSKAEKIPLDGVTEGSLCHSEVEALRSRLEQFRIAALKLALPDAMLSANSTLNSMSTNGNNSIRMDGLNADASGILIPHRHIHLNPHRAAIAISIYRLVLRRLTQEHVASLLVALSSLSTESNMHVGKSQWVLRASRSDVRQLVEESLQFNVTGGSRYAKATKNIEAIVLSSTTSSVHQDSDISARLDSAADLVSSIADHLSTSSSILKDFGNSSHTHTKALYSWSWAIPSNLIFGNYIRTLKEVADTLRGKSPISSASNSVPSVPSTVISGAGSANVGGSAAARRLQLLQATQQQLQLQKQQEGKMSTNPSQFPSASDLRVLLNKLMSCLHGLFSEHLAPLESFPLHESSTFTSISILTRFLTPNIRGASYTALTRPWHLYGGAGPQLESTGRGAGPSSARTSLANGYSYRNPYVLSVGPTAALEPSPLLPDIVNIFRIAARARGRLVHCGWLWEALREVHWPSIAQAHLEQFGEHPVHAHVRELEDVEEGSRKKIGEVTRQGIAEAMSKHGQKVEIVNISSILEEKKVENENGARKEKTLTASAIKRKRGRPTKESKRRGIAKLRSMPGYSPKGTIKNADDNSDDEENLPNPTLMDTSIPVDVKEQSKAKQVVKGKNNLSGVVSMSHLQSSLVATVNNEKKKENTLEEGVGSSKSAKRLLIFNDLKDSDSNLSRDVSTPVTTSDNNDIEKDADSEDDVADIVDNDDDDILFNNNSQLFESNMSPARINTNFFDTEDGITHSNSDSLGVHDGLNSNHLIDEEEVNIDLNAAADDDTEQNGVSDYKQSGNSKKRRKQEKLIAEEIRNMSRYRSTYETALLMRFWRAIGQLIHHGVFSPYKNTNYLEKLLFNLEDW